jgi:hypothetical protein
MRFRDFQGDLVMQYAMRNPNAFALGVAIDSPSRLMLYELAKLDQRFYQLLVDTPGLAKTPELKRLIAYEAHLLEIGVALTSGLEQAGFVPTADPLASDDGEDHEDNGDGRARQ